MRKITWVKRETLDEIFLFHKDLARMSSSFVVLRIGTVPAGHTTSSTPDLTLVGAIFTLDFSSLMRKLGRICNKWKKDGHKLCKLKKINQIENCATCNLWFFNKGWSKAGCLFISTQSIMYPNFVYKNHKSQTEITIMLCVLRSNKYPNQILVNIIHKYSW